MGFLLNELWELEHNWWLIVMFQFCIDPDVSEAIDGRVDIVHEKLVTSRLSNV